MEGKLDKLENEWLIRYVKNNYSLREALYDRADKLKKLMLSKNLPIIQNNSHIVPLLVKDPVRCK